MKRLTVVLLVIMVSIVSCTINNEQDMVTDNGEYSFQPEPLDDEWSKWLVGEWECRVEGDVGEGTGWIKIEFGLNGQFLIMKGQGDASEITDEQIQGLKKALGVSDEDIERLKSSPFKELQIHTINPKNGEVVGYLFDSLRCVATGKGRREGNKEIMEWQWFVQGRGSTSIRIIEKISDNKFTLNHKYTLANGNKMEDRAVMTRKKKPADK